MVLCCICAAFALQSLEMSAKVEIFALNVLRAVFANRWWKSGAHHKQNKKLLPHALHRYCCLPWAIVPFFLA